MAKKWRSRTIRLAVISHSNVAERQRRFWDKTRNYFKDLEVYEMYPEHWGPHTRKGGFKVLNEGSIYTYDFYSEDWLDMEINGKPDVIYVQAEAKARVVQRALDAANHLDVGLVLFVWENQKEYSDREAERLERCDMVICGNKEAEELVKSCADVETYILPQVGIDFDLFTGLPEEPRYDFGFFGRNDPMKGGDVLWRAMEGIRPPVKMYWHDRQVPIPYEELLYRYNLAKYHVAPSHNVDGLPREQFAPAVNVEALACERQIVTTRLPSIQYWLKDIPGIHWVNPSDSKDLHDMLEYLLHQEWAANEEGRKKANVTLSIDAVGKQLMPLLEKCQH